MTWERRYSRKRDMKVRVLDKGTNQETNFEGKDCTFIKSHIPGAREVRETITCESVNLQGESEKMSEKSEEKETETKPKACKVSISIDAEGKPKVQLSGDCSQSVNEVLEAVDKKQYETLYSSLSKLNEVKRILKHKLGETIKRLPSDNPEQISLDVVDLKFQKEEAIETIEKAQNEVLKVIDFLKLGEEERDVLNKISNALTRIRGETSSQKMKK